MTAPVDEASARKVAAAFLAGTPEADRTLGAVESVADASGATLAYLFHLLPAGYLVVPATRTNTLPILAHSFDSSLPSGAAGRETLLDVVRLDVWGRLLASQAGSSLPRELARKNEARWNSYLAGEERLEDSSQRAYGPFCWTPTWNQDTPYNDRCPMDPDPNYPGRCVTGCVATAYAQVFNRWLSPTAYTFTAADSYTTRTRRIAVNATTANFSGIIYNGGAPDNDTVAKVSYAAGVLSRMNYTSESSAAYTIDVGKALSNRWGYGPTREIRFEPDDAFDSTAMVANLTASPGRPVVVAIRKYDYDAGRSNGGHAIVVDGYNDSAGTFHMNMGWGGSKDGWYSLPTGMPSGYNYIAGYVYDIAPRAPGRQGTDQAPGPVPANEFPENGDTGVSIDETLDWDDCADADYYRCYLWRSGDSKPVTPTFPNLPYPVAGPEWYQ